MAKVGEMIPSKFLKKEDVEPAVLATIKHVDRVNIAKEGADPEYRYAMSFEELDKPLVLNTTNIQACQMICNGAEDTEDWLGHKIVLYHEPNIMYAGKLVGGIRIRKPKGAVAAAIEASKKVLNKAQTVDELEDDLPFRQALVPGAV